MSPSYLHQDILQLKVSMSHLTLILSYLTRNSLSAEVSMSTSDPEPSYLQPGYSPAEDILQLKSRFNSTHEPVFLHPDSPAERSSCQQSKPMSRLTFTRIFSQAEGLHVNIRPMSPSYLHQDILQLKVSMSTSNP
eukprot:gene13764-19668_t